MKFREIKNLSSLKTNSRPIDKTIFYPILKVKFHVKNNQVFICRDYEKLKMEFLLENDAQYFFDRLKTLERCEFHTLEHPFYLTNEDWKVIGQEMRTILLFITEKCNSQCSICYRNSSVEGKFNNEMSLEDIEKIIHKIGKNKNIVLVGGEPTVREDIFDIIKTIRRSGNIPLIFTNGLKLANLGYVKRLKKSGVNKLHFSFDGFRKDIYEKLRGNGKQLYIKLKAIKNLERVGIKVFLSSTIVDGINEDEIPRLLKFAVRNIHFIKKIYFFGGTPYGRFDIEMRKFLTPSDIIKILDKATFHKINKTYVLQFEKLKFNISSLTKKYRFLYPFRVVGFFFTVKNGDIQELIPLKELKEINYYLERGKLITPLLKLIKYIKISSIPKRLLKYKKLEQDLLGNDLLQIYIANICTPLNYLPAKCDVVRLVKLHDKIMAWPAADG